MPTGGFGITQNPLAELEQQIKKLEAEVNALKVGAWLALEEVSANLKVVAGWEEPHVRVEGNGARAYLKGIYEATAEITIGTQLFKVPAGTRPPTRVGPTVSFETATSGACRLPVTSAGVVTAAVTLVKGSFIYLDGASWNLT
jgi:hypothetical protein